MKNQFQHGQGPARDAHIDHRQIAELLTRSTNHLDEGVVSALRQARTVALQKQRVHEHVFSLSTIGHRVHNLRPHSTHQWVAAVIVLAAIVFGMATYWQQDQQNPDLEILTGDLPIDVFVDK
jgi:hypothetical protein